MSPYHVSPGAVGKGRPADTCNCAVVHLRVTRVVCVVVRVSDVACVGGPIVRALCWQSSSGEQCCMASTPLVVVGRSRPRLRLLLHAATCTALPHAASRAPCCITDDARRCLLLPALRSATRGIPRQLDARARCHGLARTRWHGWPMVPPHQQAPRAPAGSTPRSGAMVTSCLRPQRWRRLPFSLPTTCCDHRQQCCRHRCLVG